MTRLILASLVITFWPIALAAETTYVEDIHYLIDSVRHSECIFIRNGKEYSAIDAAQHLQMKFDRVRKRIKTTDQFIEKIASKSSISGKAYLIRCDQQDELKSTLWFYRQLEHRS